jgi:hypothetical protein
MTKAKSKPKKSSAEKVTASKQTITIRLDRDVLAQFRMSGPGYQTRINEVLREHVHPYLTGCTPECHAAAPRLREMQVREVRRPQ